MMKRESLIESLRGIADFYEKHPDFPLPQNDELRVYSGFTPEIAKEQVSMFLDGAEHVEKESKEDDNYIRLLRFPNGLKFLLSVDKKALGCRKVTHMRTITEERWECGPLLEAIAELKDGGNGCD